MRILAQWCNGHSVIVAVSILVLPFFSALLLDAGATSANGPNPRLLTLGGLTLLLSMILTGLQEWGSRASQHEAAQTIVLSGDALSPMLQLIAEMPAMTNSKRSTHLTAVMQNALGAIQLLFPDIPRLRASVFRQGHHGMDAVAHMGRSHPPGNFVRGTPRGDHALALVDNRASRRVDDVELEADLKEEGGPPRAYRSFVSAAIFNEHKAFGMLSVDAPDVGAFDETDEEALRLIARVLAVAFSIADPARG